MKRQKIEKLSKTPTATSRKVGYARVSTNEQDLFMQTEALKKFGCAPIFVEKISAVSSKRYQWMLTRKFLEAGDTLVVWSMSRIGRDASHLIEIERELSFEGVTIHSLTEPAFDTATAHGRLMFTVKAAFDQFEREVTQERTRSGLKALKDAGHQLGRERTILPATIKAMKRDLKDPKHTVVSVAKKYGISTASVYAYIPGGKSGLVRK